MKWNQISVWVYPTEEKERQECWWKSDSQAGWYRTVEERNEMDVVLISSHSFSCAFSLALPPASSPLDFPSSSMISLVSPAFSSPHLWLLREHLLGSVVPQEPERPSWECSHLNQTKCLWWFSCVDGCSWDSLSPSPALSPQGQWWWEGRRRSGGKEGLTCSFGQVAFLASLPMLILHDFIVQ